MRMIGDGHGAMLRGLRRLMMADPVLAPLLDRQMPSLTIEGLASETWASATFSGHRHRLDLRLRGTSAELDRARARLEARLPAADLDLRGHVLVDMTLTAAETLIEDGEQVCRLRFEALTVED
jgi:hypothetical protein